jgi:protocadherin Fat 4
MTFQVSAFDMDEGLNSQIRYSIIAGDPNQDFSMGDDSGILRVARGLNYERKRAYTLTVQAQDLGEDSRYDTTTVSITIMDVNDR